MSNIPDDVKHKALEHCREFMGGTWKVLKYDDFKISHVSGGLSNLLYLCEIINKSVDTVEEEPRKVLLRYYGSIIRENPDTVVTDSVVFGLLAEKGLGPKLYGVFTDGRVEQYVESRHLWTSELHMEHVSRECARVMSMFHKMTMPLVKKPTWLPQIMDRYLKESEEILRLVNKAGGRSEKFPPEMLAKINSYNIAKELQTLKNILAQVESPVIFCHNDFQEGNILLFNNPESENVHIQAIDFEYCSYNYRGFDIGNHFCEWCYNYHQVTEYPFYSAKPEDYPNRDQQLNFVRAYKQGMGITDSTDPLNTDEHIMLEANAYALASHYMWALWSIIQANISTIDFGYLEYAISRFEHYFTQKNQLIAAHGLSSD